MARRILFTIISFIGISAFAQDINTEKPILLTGCNNDLNTLCMSPAKMKRMAVAGWNNEILVYQSDSPFHLVQKLTGHTAQINSITYNLQGNMMASASGDMSIRLYDSMYRYIPLKEDPLNRHQVAVNALIFDRAGKFIFSGDKEGKLVLWDVMNKNAIKFYQTGNSINDLCLSPNVANIFVAHSDKQIKLYALAGGKLIKTLDGHTDAVNALAISANNLFLISGSNDKTARIWDLKTWKPMHILQAESWKVTAVSFTDDSKYCATGSNDGWVKVWEVNSGKLVSKTLLDDLNIRDLAFSKDNKFILVAPKLRESGNFGARIISSQIPLPVAPALPVKPLSPAQKSLDSIMAIRPLNRQDSVKYKNILFPKPLIKNGQAQGKNQGNNSTPIDSAIIYKTPMNPIQKKK